MPGRSFTEGEKATAITLARLTTVDTAAATLGIDRRTLRGWVKSAPPPDESDAWRAAELMAQQQLLTSLATGKVKQPNILAVVAGIASDKLQRLARRREAEQRKAGEAAVERPEPDPVHDAVQAMPADAKRPFRDWLYLLIERDSIRRQAGIENEAATVGWTEDDFAARIREYGQMTDAERQRLVDGVVADVKRYTESWRVIRTGIAPNYMHHVLDANGAEFRNGSHLDPLYAHLPVVDEARLPPVRNVTPKPVPESVEPPETALKPLPALPMRPDVELIGYGSHLDDHPSWRRWG